MKEGISISQTLSGVSHRKLEDKKNPVNQNYEYSDNDILKIWDCYLRKKQCEYLIFSKTQQLQQANQLFSVEHSLTVLHRAGLIVNQQGELYLTPTHPDSQHHSYSLSICDSVNYESDIRRTGGVNQVTDNLKVGLDQIILWQYTKKPPIRWHQLLFPYHIHAGHWGLGVLKLEFVEGSNKLSNAELCAYDPMKGNGIEIREQLLAEINLLLKQLFEYSLDVKKHSEGLSQQQDGTSCGVITAENGCLVIEGKALAAPYLIQYAAGAEQARIKHLELVNSPEFNERQRFNRTYHATGDQPLLARRAIEDAFIQFLLSTSDAACVKEKKELKKCLILFAKTHDKSSSDQINLRKLMDESESLLINKDFDDLKKTDSAEALAQFQQRLRTKIKDLTQNDPLQSLLKKIQIDANDTTSLYDRIYEDKKFRDGADDNFERIGHRLDRGIDKNFVASDANKMTLGTENSKHIEHKTLELNTNNLEVKQTIDKEKNSENLVKKKLQRDKSLSKLPEMKLDDSPGVYSETERKYKPVKISLTVDPSIIALDKDICGDFSADPVELLKFYYLLESQHANLKFELESNSKNNATEDKSIYQKIYFTHKNFRREMQKCLPEKARELYFEFHYRIVIEIYAYYIQLAKSGNNKIPKYALQYIQACLDKAVYFANIHSKYYEKMQALKTAIDGKIGKLQLPNKWTTIDQLILILELETQLTVARQTHDTTLKVRVLYQLSLSYEAVAEYKLAFKYIKASRDLFAISYQEFNKAENLQSNLHSTVSPLSPSEIDKKLFRYVADDALITRKPGQETEDIQWGPGFQGEQSVLQNFNEGLTNILNYLYGSLHEDVLFGENENSGVKLLDDFSALKTLKNKREFIRFFEIIAANHSNIPQQDIKKVIDVAALLDTAEMSIDQLILMTYESITQYSYYVIHSRMSSIQIFEKFDKYLYEKLNEYQSLQTQRDKIAGDLQRILSKINQCLVEKDYQQQCKVYTEFVELIKTYFLTNQPRSTEIYFLYENLIYLLTESKSNHASYIADHLNDLQLFIHQYMNPFDISLHISELGHEIIEIIMMAECTRHMIDAVKQKYPPPWQGKELRFIAKKAIYYDCHFNKSDFAGANLVFISPVHEVVLSGMPCHINTDGESIDFHQLLVGKALDGENGRESDKDGKPGMHGNNGTYGAPGGNVCLIGRQLDIENKIIFSAKGSEGGPGQEGGDGGLGYNGDDGEDGAADKSVKSIRFGSSHWWHWLSVAHGEEATSGGYGGAAGYGGAVGCGGSGGKIECIDLDKTLNVIDRRDSNGLDAKAGKPGQIGKGGYYGRPGTDHYFYHDAAAFPFRKSKTKEYRGLLIHPEVDRWRGRYRLRERIYGRGNYGAPKIIQSEGSNYFKSMQRRAKSGKKSNVRINSLNARENIRIDKQNCFERLYEQYKKSLKHWNKDSLNNFLMLFAERVHKSQNFEEIKHASRGDKIKAKSVIWINKIKSQFENVSTTIHTRRKQKTVLNKSQHILKDYTGGRSKRILSNQDRDEKNDWIITNFEEFTRLWPELTINGLERRIKEKKNSTALLDVLDEIIKDNNLVTMTPILLLNEFVNEIILFLSGFLSNWDKINELEKILRNYYEEQLNISIKKIAYAKFIINSYHYLRTLVNDQQAFLSLNITYAHHLYKISSISEQEELKDYYEQICKQGVIINCFPNSTEILSSSQYLLTNFIRSIHQFNEFPSISNLINVIYKYIYIFLLVNFETSDERKKYMNLLKQYGNYADFFRVFFQVLTENFAIFLGNNLFVEDHKLLYQLPTAEIEGLLNDDKKEITNCTTFLKECYLLSQNIKYRPYCVFDQLMADFLLDLQEKNLISIEASVAVDMDKSLMLPSRVDSIQAQIQQLQEATYALMSLTTTRTIQHFITIWLNFRKSMVRIEYNESGIDAIYTELETSYCIALNKIFNCIFSLKADPVYFEKLQDQLQQLLNLYNNHQKYEQLTVATIKCLIISIVTIRKNIIIKKPVEQNDHLIIDFNLLFDNLREILLNIKIEALKKEDLHETLNDFSETFYLLSIDLQILIKKLSAVSHDSVDIEQKRLWLSELTKISQLLSLFKNRLLQYVKNYITVELKICEVHQKKSSPFLPYKEDFFYLIKDSNADSWILHGLDNKGKQIHDNLSNLSKLREIKQILLNKKSVQDITLLEKYQCLNILLKEIQSNKNKLSVNGELFNILSTLIGNINSLYAKISADIDLGQEIIISSTLHYQFTFNKLESYSIQQMALISEFFIPQNNFLCDSDKLLNFLLINNLKHHLNEKLIYSNNLQQVFVNWLMPAYLSSLLIEAEVEEEKPPRLFISQLEPDEETINNCIFSTVFLYPKEEDEWEACHVNLSKKTKLCSCISVDKILEILGKNTLKELKFQENGRCALTTQEEENLLTILGIVYETKNLKTIKINGQVILEENNKHLLCLVIIDTDSRRIKAVQKIKIESYTQEIRGLRVTLANTRTKDLVIFIGDSRAKTKEINAIIREFYSLTAVEVSRYGHPILFIGKKSHQFVSSKLTVSDLVSRAQQRICVRGKCFADLYRLSLEQFDPLLQLRPILIMLNQHADFIIKFEKQFINEMNTFIEQNVFINDCNVSDSLYILEKQLFIVMLQTYLDGSWTAPENNKFTVKAYHVIESLIQYLEQLDKDLISDEMVLNGYYLLGKLLLSYTLSNSDESNTFIKFQYKLCANIDVDNYHIVANLLLFIQLIHDKYNKYITENQLVSPECNFWETLLLLIIEFSEIRKIKNMESLLFTFQWLDAHSRVIQNNKNLFDLIHLPNNESHIEMLCSGFSIIVAMVNLNLELLQKGDKLQNIVDWYTRPLGLHAQLKKTLDRIQNEKLFRILRKRISAENTYALQEMLLYLESDNDSLPASIINYLNNVYDQSDTVTVSKSQLTYLLKKEIFMSCLDQQIHYVFNLREIINKHKDFDALLDSEAYIKDFVFWLIANSVQIFKDQQYIRFIEINNIFEFIYNHIKENGLQLSARAFCQVLKSITISSDFSIVKSVLQNYPQSKWPTALLINCFLEYYQECFKGSSSDEIEKIKKILLTIDYALLKLFFNVFVEDFYNTFLESNASSSKPLINKETLITIVHWLAYIECNQYALEILCDQSLLHWDRVLCEVSFSQLLDHWINLSSKEKTRIKYFLNRIRLDNKSENFKSFFYFFALIRQKSVLVSEITTLIRLLSSIYYQHISFDEALLIVEKNEYDHWDTAIDAAIMNRSTEERTIDEIIEEVKNQEASQQKISLSMLDTIAHQAKAIKDKVFILKNDLLQQKINLETLVNFFTALECCKNMQEKEQWFHAQCIDFVSHLLVIWWLTSHEEVEKRMMPRNVQLVALLLFLHSNECGLLAQIVMGEGKTLIVGLLAAAKALLGYRVDIVSSNRDLAQEGVRKCGKFFNTLYLTCQVNCTLDDDVNHQAYRSHIVYGDVGSFQGDILQEEISDTNIFSDRYQSPHCLIVDEVDSMFLDKGKHMLYIAHPIPRLKHLESLFVTIWSAVLGLNLSNDLDLRYADIAEDVAKKMIFLMKSNQIEVPKNLQSFCEKKMLYWVQSALQARYMSENDQFVITEQNNKATQRDERKIVVVDKSTGVEEYATNWSNGLSQFLQLKFGHCFEPETLKANFISNKRFFLRYGKNLYGLTGTLGSDSSRDSLRQIYHVDLLEIPPAKRKKYKQLPGKIGFTREDWLQQIQAEVMDKINDQPILIICDNIAAVKELRKRLKAIHHQSMEIIPYKRDGDEIEKKFENCGAYPGQIIIATNKGGRGTNIKVDIEKSKKGLHVILAFIAENIRVERQAFGRTAREDQPGTGILILQVDPDLYTDECNELGKNDPLSVEIIIEKEKIKRDKEEELRITQLLSSDLFQLDAEENLYHEFSLFKKEVSQYLKNIKLFNKRMTGKVQEACLAILTEKWAFWLDAAKKEVETINNQLAMDQYLSEFKLQFIESIRKLISSESIDMRFFATAEDYLVLGQAYLEDKQYRQGLVCFETAIKKEDVTGYAGLAATFCYVRCYAKTTRKNKHQLRRYVKYAKNKLDHLRQQLMANGEVIRNLSEMVQSNQDREKIDNLYATQIKGKLKVVGLHLHYINELLGDEISIDTFISQAEAPRIGDEESEKIFNALISRGIIYQDRIRRKWQRKENFPILSQIIQERVDLSIAPTLINMIALPSRHHLKVSDLEKIVLNREDLWQLLLKGGVIVQSEPAIVIDMMIYSVSLNDKYKKLWEKFRTDHLKQKENWTSYMTDLFGNKKETDIIEEEIVLTRDKNAYGILGSKEFIELKEYLIQRGLCKEAQRAKIGKTKLAGSMLEIYANLNIKDEKNVEESLLNYLNHLLEFCATGKNGFLYEYLLPFDSKKDASEKLHAFLYSVDVLKKTGLARYKQEDDDDSLTSAITPLLRQIKINYQLNIEPLDKLEDLEKYTENYQKRSVSRHQILLIYAWQEKVVYFYGYDKNGQLIKGLVSSIELLKPLINKFPKMISYRRLLDKKEVMIKEIISLLELPKNYTVYQSAVIGKIQELRGKIRQFKYEWAVKHTMVVNLVEFYQLKNAPTDVPDELAFFTDLYLDHFLIIEDHASWWNWNAFACAMIGLAQVIAGVAIIVLSEGALTNIGFALISEGINDMVYATFAGLTNTFSWKDWAKQKIISLPLSLAFGGIGDIVAGVAVLYRICSPNRVVSITNILRRIVVDFAVECLANLITDQMMLIIQNTLLDMLIDSIEREVMQEVDQVLKDKLHLMREQQPSEEEFKKVVKEFENKLKQSFQQNYRLGELFDTLRSHFVALIQQNYDNIAKMLNSSQSSWAKLAGLGLKGIWIANMIYEVVTFALSLQPVIIAIKNSIYQASECNESNSPQVSKRDAHLQIEAQVQERLREVIRNYISIQLNQRLREVLKVLIHQCIHKVAEASTCAVHDAIKNKLEKRQYKKRLITMQQGPSDYISESAPPVTESTDNVEIKPASQSEQQKRRQFLKDEIFQPKNPPAPKIPKVTSLAHIAHGIEKLQTKMMTQKIGNPKNKINLAELVRDVKNMMRDVTILKEQLKLSMAYKKLSLTLKHTAVDENIKLIKTLISLIIIDKSLLDHLHFAESHSNNNMQAKIQNLQNYFGQELENEVEKMFTQCILGQAEADYDRVVDYLYRKFRKSTDFSGIESSLAELKELILNYENVINNIGGISMGRDLREVFSNVLTKASESVDKDMIQQVGGGIKDLFESGVLYNQSGNLLRKGQISEKGYLISTIVGDITKCQLESEKSYQSLILFLTNLSNQVGKNIESFQKDLMKVHDERTKLLKNFTDKTSENLKTALDKMENSVQERKEYRKLYSEGKIDDQKFNAIMNSLDGDKAMLESIIKLFESSQTAAARVFESQAVDKDTIKACTEASLMMTKALAETTKDLAKRTTFTDVLKEGVGRFFDTWQAHQKFKQQQQQNKNNSKNSTTAQAALSPAPASSASASTLPPLPAPKQRNYTLFNATHKFKADDPNQTKKQLTFKPGDQLRVFKTYDNGWMKAKNAQDEEGVVPSNYLQQQS